MLSRELEVGRIAGPFDTPPFDNFVCSPLGVIGSRENSAQEIFPVSVDSALLFIAYLHLSEISAASIQTYVAALSFFNRLIGAQNLGATFVIQKALVGAQRTSPAPTTRLPIHLSMLHHLLDTVSQQNAGYDRGLFRAMFTTAFHGFLRIGEITIRARNSPHYVLQFHECTVHTSVARRGVEVTLTHFKGNTARTPFAILIPPYSKPQYCPMAIMTEYLSLRGKKPGALFLDSTGQPITRTSFTAFLNKTLVAAGYSTSFFKPHSFRIGAATSAAAQGVSDDIIQRLGRWRSNAYQRYVKIPLFQNALPQS